MPVHGALQDDHRPVGVVMERLVGRLLEAVVRISGRPVVRARAWYLAALDTGAVAGGPEERLTPPESLASWPMAEVWPGGYIASLDVPPSPRLVRVVRPPGCSPTST